jgi:hypothetical protein
MTDKTSIIDKIRKVLALSSSPNEAEAASAAAKVQEMLAEYKLTMADLEAENQQEVIRDSDFLTDRAAWIKPLMQSVAKLCFCGYFFETFPADWVRKHGLDQTSSRLLAGSRFRIFYRHNFIGKEADVLAAKILGAYLIEAMQRLCREARKAYPKDEQKQFTISFMNACTSRLCMRIMERYAASRASGTGNLPALLSLYDKAQNDAKEFLEGEKVKLTTKKNLMKINHRGGSDAGWKAGAEIGLDTQIDGHGKDPRLTAA